MFTDCRVTLRNAGSSLRLALYTEKPCVEVPPVTKHDSASGQEMPVIMLTGQSLNVGGVNRSTQLVGSAVAKPAEAVAASSTVRHRIAESKEGVCAHEGLDDLAARI